MWHLKEIYKEIHPVQIPLSFLLYLNYLDLLLECHFLKKSNAQERNQNDSDETVGQLAHIQD